METLAAMAAERKAHNLVPEDVEMVELQHKVSADLKMVLNELCREKAIGYYKTINSVAFKIKPGQEQ